MYFCKNYLSDTMNDLKQIKWGFIGCGEVTEKKSGPAFNAVEGSQVVAVMSRKAEKAQSYAERHGVKRWYTDPQELVNDREVNAVYIATQFNPSFRHYKIPRTVVHSFTVYE